MTNSGVGRTELAIQTAQGLMSRYPDGVFWIGLRTYAVAAESHLEVTRALRMLLSAINENPDPAATSEADLAVAWRTASADLRILLILDADRPEQVESLMPSGADSAVLITTRNVLIGIDPDCCVDLQPFDHFMWFNRKLDNRS